MYTAASGMIAQQRRQEMLSNNMSNASTPGFKADQASIRTFPRMLIANLEQRNESSSNELSTGVYLQEMVPNFFQGNVMETKNQTDIALIDGNLPEDGALFFAVQSSEGVRYTRNGNFTIDSTGTLVTNQGMHVLDTNGNPIVLRTEDFAIRPDGTIIEDGNEIARLNVVFSENANELVKEGYGLFRIEGNELESAIGNPNVSYQLQQGFLERSNVNVEQTMIEMMQAYRTFEVNQRVLQTYDQSLDKAVNEIGKL